MLKKLFAIWRYYGCRGAAAKLWEKCAVDRRRFSPKGKTDIPLFAPCPNLPELPLLTDKKPRYIYYLTHCFYPDRQGGTERFVLNMARAQQARGHRVKVFTLGTKDQSAYSSFIGGILYRTFFFQGVEVVEFRYKQTPYGLFYKRLEQDDPEMQTFAALFLRTDQPDVVHCAYPQPMAPFLAACVEQHVPYVATLTDFNILCHYATMVDSQGHFCSGCERGEKCARLCKTSTVPNLSQRYKNAQRLLQNAAAVTAPSAFVAAVIHQAFPGIVPRVIPHGIAAEFAVSHTFAGGVHSFAYIGTLSELKGVHLLIAAFRKLPGEYSLDIYGAGNGAYERQLKAQIGQDHRICLRGPVPFDRMPQVYDTHDCVVVPSLWYETYNFVVREALAADCLVVASRIGAMPEAIEEGENGFLFAPGNEQALLEALRNATGFQRGMHTPPQPTISWEAEQYERIFESL